MLDKCLIDNGIDYFPMAVKEQFEFYKSYLNEYPFMDFIYFVSEWSKLIKNNKLSHMTVTNKH